MNLWFGGGAPLAITSVALCNPIPYRCQAERAPNQGWPESFSVAVATRENHVYSAAVRAFVFG